MTQNFHKDEDLHRKNARLMRIVLLVVVGMVGMAFASVPLYDMFCRVTGFGGTTMLSDSLPDRIVERSVTIKFDANTSRALNWDFRPEEHEQRVKLGQQGLIAFVATNRSARPITGTAVYNVTPTKVGQYFHKIQCFCFDEQLLNPRQTMQMPVMYYIDPAMNDDRNMDDVTTITLSYSFFQAQSQELDKALEAFYNAEED